MIESSTKPNSPPGRSDASFESLLGKLSEHSGERGREFERICQWFLQTAAEYRTELRRVWLWDDWPGRWAADAGIDLIAETVTGDLWAIQAKAYDPAYTIKKADVDSFLSESARAEFSYRLLIATTDRIGRTARRTLAGQEKPAGLLLRSQLAVSEVAWPSSPDDLRPSPPSRKRPLPHQSEAVAAVEVGLRSSERGQLVMACGTGKTLTACFLAYAIRAQRVLVLVPSLSLLAQTIREWALASEFRYLAVCSDETVTAANADAVVSSTSELGFPVTTDPHVIAEFLRAHGGEMRVIFATYQSSPRVAAAQALGKTSVFDLAIADEAHRCAGPEAGVFATVLDPEKIKAHKRLFMTATPRYFTGRIRREAHEADWEIASMDDELRFGRVLHRLSFASAIEQGLLSDYRVAVVGVSDAAYRNLAERGVFVTVDGERITDARTLASQLGLLRAMVNYDLRRVVTFHSRIRGASAFARSLPEVCTWLPLDRRPTGSLWAEHVSGEMTSGERDNRLSRLRSVVGAERGVLTNARCLAEGVDVPTLDGIAFNEPRRSQVDIVQAVGRAIRKAPDKTIGTIVIPVFVNENADAEQEIESSEFRRVWDVVKALRAHDEALAEELDELRRELGRRSTSIGRPGKIRLDLPLGIDEAFARAFDTRLIETTSPSWEFFYGLLERFIDREGHALVPTSHSECGHRLGQWVAGQRTSYRVGRMSGKRAARLSTLPGWVWQTYDAAWERGFSHLTRYASRTRHTRLPRNHSENGYPLGQWVHEQRKDYRAGQLSPERISKLQALPDWSWAVADSAWENGYSSLERFAARYGNTHVPQSYTEETDGFALGQWVSRQRRLFSHGRLSVERAARLEMLPSWTWDIYDATWERGFGSLTRFVTRERHASVPATHVEDGFQLGTWTQHQRSAYRARRLTSERAARLAELPGWTWTPYDAAWEQGFSLLERFAVREGNARVPTSHVEDGYPLGQWVAYQRSAHRAGRLSDARAARLAALPGWAWNRNDAAWNEGYAALERFAKRERHTCVPHRYAEDGYRLGQWVADQRKNFRAGRLSAERASRLEALPEWTWSGERSQRGVEVS